MKVIIDGDVILYMSICRKEAISFDKVIQNWNDRIESIIESNFADGAIICLSTDGENFRKLNYDWYKSNRKQRETPEHLFELKEWAFENDPDVIGSPGGEADDHMMIEACKLKESGEPYVIATIDKDLRTIPGLYYNVRKQERDLITMEEAYDYMMLQFLTGDMGDSIPGIKGIGPVKGNKILDGYETYEEKWNGIKETWKEKKGEDWERGFNNCVNGVFIRRREQDLFPMEFAGRSWDDFLPLLRVCLPDN